MRPLASRRWLAAAVLLAAACGDQQPTAVQRPVDGDVPETALQAFDCTASIHSSSVSCAPAAPAGAGSRSILGGQNSLLKLTSSNVSYDAGTEIFQFDVTVQNLLNEAMGTPDGTVPDPQGIRAFFHAGPTVTSGTGSVSVANADGVADITGEEQPYFAYNEILSKDEVSSSKTWQLSAPASVGSVSFKIYIETDVQYLLVINEVLANPANYNTNPDVNGEWFEVYNAGTLKVNLQNLVIADSAQSGRRPYHLISSSLVVPSGGYVVLGQSTNTTANGGVPVDYAYGNVIALANSLDALKIARVVGTDTLTLDRVQYASAATSAQDGISRELKNPLLDNSNMDGSNWASALVTAVYGPGGRGTPKAQNSTYTP
nr:lamin tail domain-containing protein [Longimicrobium terrae]